MKIDKKYWDDNYYDLDSMDGVANAFLHAKYLSTTFRLEGIKIQSLVDLGFGLGFMFEEMVKAFRPKDCQGIEPSRYAFSKAKKRYIKNKKMEGVSLYNADLLTWCRKENQKKFDLGICSSVFQYIDSKDLEICLPILSKRFKYLYLTVPTDKELDRQTVDLEFTDKYALRRPKSFYIELIGAHFNFISSRLVESKYYFDEDNTHFTELLFHFS